MRSSTAKTRRRKWCSDSSRYGATAPGNRPGATRPRCREGQTQNVFDPLRYGVKRQVKWSAIGDFSTGRSHAAHMLTGDVFGRLDVDERAFRPTAFDEPIDFDAIPTAQRRRSKIFTKVDDRRNSGFPSLRRSANRWGAWPTRTPAQARKNRPTQTRCEQNQMVDKHSPD